MSRHFWGLPALTTAVMLSVMADSAAQVDGGEILQDLLRPPPLDERLPAPEALELPRAAQPAPSDRVTITDVQLEGNTRFSDAMLRELIEERLGQRFSMAELRGMAAVIQDYYRQRGYLAQVIMPEQSLGDGLLTIQVVEARPGQISLRRSADDHPGPVDLDWHRRFIDHALDDDPLFRIDQLERANRLLGDLPGVTADVTLAPGASRGLTDVDVILRRAPLFGGRVTLDNTGSDATGTHRARADLALEAPFGRGTRASMLALGAEGTRYGRVGADLPIGHDGLELALAGSALQYDLVDEFSVLSVEGQSRTLSAELAYPWSRAGQQNIYLQAGADWTEFEDRARQAIQERRQLRGLYTRLAFDRRDRFAGGGISYGQLEIRAGDVDFAIGTQSTRELTEGRFERVSAELLRIQSAPGVFARQAVLRLSLDGQYSEQHLDSSEGYSLGGRDDIRAFPVSEISGDYGASATIEWREDLLPALTGFVFYDHGWVRQRAEPDRPGSTYQLAGAGVGADIQLGEWLTLAVSAAHPTRDNPLADATTDRNSDGTRQSWRGWVALEADF